MVRGSCVRDGGDFNHEWAGIFTNGEGTGNGVRGAGVRDGGFWGKWGEGEGAEIIFLRGGGEEGKGVEGGEWILPRQMGRRYPWGRGWSRGWWKW